MYADDWARLRNYLAANQTSIREVTVTRLDGTEVSGELSLVDLDADLFLLSSQGAAGSITEFAVDRTNILRAIVNPHDGAQTTY